VTMSQHIPSHRDGFHLPIPPWKGEVPDPHRELALAQPLQPGEVLGGKAGGGGRGEHVNGAEA